MEEDYVWMDQAAKDHDIQESRIMRKFAWIALALMAIIIVAACRADAPPQSPKPPQAPEVQPAPMTYATAYAQALRENKPLVVFVGCPCRKVDWAVTIRCDDFPPAARQPLIAVGVPDGQGQFDLMFFPTTTSNEFMRTRALLRGVQITSPQMTYSAPVFAPCPSGNCRRR